MTIIDVSEVNHQNNFSASCLYPKAFKQNSLNKVVIKQMKTVLPTLCSYSTKSNLWKNLIHFRGKKSELRYLLVFIQTSGNH